MAKIVLNDITNVGQVSVINDNFDRIEQEFQDKVLYRQNPVGEPNTIHNDVDVNGYDLYNISEVRAQVLILDGIDVNDRITDAIAATETAAAEAEASADRAEDAADIAVQAASETASTISPVEFANYASLRAYTGSAAHVHITGYVAVGSPSGIEGAFTRDDADVTSADNGGTVIVTALGVRYKRNYEGPVSTEWFQLSTLNGLVAVLGSTTPVEVLVERTLTVTGNITVPANIALTWARGGTIALSTFTVTMNGVFTAPRKTVFTYTTGIIVFGPGSVDWVFPEWFGATISSSSTPIDSAAAFRKTLECTSFSTAGFAYKVSLAQGCYYFASGVDIPAGGVCHIEGQSSGSSSIRGMNGGSGFPNYLFKLVNSTFGTRFINIFFYSGSTSSPMLHAIDSDELSHVSIVDCQFQYFSRAAIVCTEWSNYFNQLEFAFCGVGIWMKRAGGNNNDITIDACRFVGCNVGIVTNGGVATRITNCQFQGGTTSASASITHIYAAKANNITIDTCYFENQTPGMRGMDFTVPETFTMYAYIIFNDAEYMDASGVVTTTLSRNLSVPNLSKITGCSFLNAAGYQHAGGSGYTAGAVNLVATSGTGSGATATAAVSGGKVTSVSAISGGTGYKNGDFISIQQGGGTGAVGMVTATGALGAITTLAIGQQAAVYVGSSAEVELTNCYAPPSSGLISVYKDRAYSDFARLILSGNRSNITASQLPLIVLGNYTDVLDLRLSQISDSMTAIRYSDYMGRSNLAQGVPMVPSIDPPVNSTITIQSGYRGYPVKRITLDPAQTTSERWSGTFPIATSGANNSDMAGRKVYFSLWRVTSLANIKVRLTLSANVGGTIIACSNYDSSTAFTSTASFAREEVSLTMPQATATVTWSIEVIAAAAGAGQYADLMGLTIAPVGIPMDAFSRNEHRQPLLSSVSWTPGLIADGATAVIGAPVVMYGVGFGDEVSVQPPGNTFGAFIQGYINAANQVTLFAQNETGGAVTPAPGTYRIKVTPRL